MEEESRREHGSPEPTRRQPRVRFKVSSHSGRVRGTLIYDPNAIGSAQDRWRLIGERA